MEGISENVRKQFLVNEPGKKQREAFKQMESSSNLLLSRLSSFLPQLAKENDSLFDDLQTGKKTAADVDIEVLGEKEDDDAEEEPQHIEMVRVSFALILILEFGNDYGRRRVRPRGARSSC
jgi:hypothetical protein